MKRKREIILLGILILLMFVINYSFVDNAVVEFLDDYETTIVERVIDGDTIVVGNDTHVRLLGINTPEKGEKYYNEAKNFLSMVILNKTVELRFGKERYDRYGRELAYVFYNDANVNLELVDEGYANFYFPSGKDEYYDRAVKNWEHCISNNKYLCEKSDDKCADCVELEEFENQEVIFGNNCNFECDLTGWSIKDEGRKKFIFGDFVLEKNKEVKIIVGNKTNSNGILYWKNEDYVWTETGDTLFLRDKGGKLVLWKKY
ncbi:MAG: thermonuclease family protein [Candidatus Nanoarchaeia archaeon]|nr:thermonuclease family protein [Candidatus Nanoarchaeia archaeon]MDD5357705.1 thermonuclease family protein [Candidatus Nanoarchaeia archaeon]MDD5588624.1 thermonuclease family protein [Candidatus Nanoarchaeia archaeon]